MFTELLEQLGLVLNAAGIPYMLIGGQAVLLYGEPRLTRDIDLTLGIGPEHLPDFLKMVETIGLQVRVADAMQFVTQTMVLPCEQPGTGIRVDFLGSSLFGVGKAFEYTPWENRLFGYSPSYEEDGTYGSRNALRYGLGTDAALADQAH